MAYAEIEPAPELKPWVAAYWHFRVRPGTGEIEHWIPLTGGTMLAFPRGGPASIVGPRVTPLRTMVHGGDVLWGVHFWPGAGVSLLGPGAGALRERLDLAREALGHAWLEPLREVLAAEDDEEAAARRLDAALLPRIDEASPLDETVMTAVFRLIASGGGLRVQELADGLGLSTRQLRRRFRAATDLTPKELARLQRMRACAQVVISPDPERWIDVAAEHGYADQAHLVREFRRILGLTPAAFGDHARRIRHGRLVR